MTDKLNLGQEVCFGEEEGVTYKVYYNSSFVYTIIVEKGDQQLIETHQGVRAFFGHDSLDVQWVNEKMDRMINEIKGKLDV